jgi:hypothetical protein
MQGHRKVSVWHDRQIFAEFFFVWPQFLPHFSPAFFAPGLKVASFCAHPAHFVMLRTELCQK